MTTTAAHDVDQVIIDDIRVDEHHPRRMSEKAFQASCEDLAGKIAREGMLTPIKICDDPENSTAPLLVFGLRRLTAARSLGWHTIPAIDGGAMTREEIEAERLSENLNREDPSPIDEMVGVNALYDATRDAINRADGYESEDAIHAAVVDSVAERMGRTPAWVRDRLYLRRLTPMVQDLVISEHIPLAHARQLAKLGDEKEQLELASYCRREDDGTGGIHVDQLEFQVGRRLTRLAGVLWPLDAEFAGKPACIGCQHNTATDALLFEGGDASDKAHCLHKSCYNAKSKAANTAAEKAVAKIVKMTIDGKLESAGPKILTEKNLVPKGVKPASLAARVRARIARENPAAIESKPAPATRKGVEQTTEQKHEQAAYEAWRVVEREWHEKESSVVDEAIKADPLKLFALWLFQMTEDKQADAVCKKHRDQVRKFLTEQQISTGQFELVASQVIRSVFGGKRSWMATEFYYRDVAEDVAVMLIGEMPDREEWIRQWMLDNPLPAEEPKPAGKEKAGKKKAAKKAGKKKAKRSPRKGAAS